LLRSEEDGGQLVAGLVIDSERQVFFIPPRPEPGTDINPLEGTGASFGTS